VSSAEYGQSSGQTALGDVVDVSRVMVVDDHRTFAELLARALDAEDDLVCVGHARDGEEAIRMVGELRPDLVLMDLELPGRDGISVTAELTAADPDLKVLILTAHAGTGELTRAGAAGACGFLAKDGSLDEVLDALRTAHRGSLLLPSEVAAGFARVPRPRAEEAGLTPRELEVLRLLGQGREPRAIARELGVSLYTCRGYVKSVLAKLDVHSQLEAVVAASRSGLIRIGE
jgi:DNA-binding NarL/FixJ family response regulator